MFILIESEQEIKEAQCKLEATIKREFNSRGTRNIGYPGGTNLKERIFTDKEIKYWYSSSPKVRKSSPNPRYLNWFGLYKEEGALHISVEINIPHEGQNKRIAGFFARDTSTEKIYLMHSGGIGGGAKGVGKNDFLAWMTAAPCGRGQIHKVTSPSGTSFHHHAVLVMPIEGNAATKSAIRYIETVNDFKEKIRLNPEYLSTPEFKETKNEFKDYYPEPRGKRTGKRAEDFNYLSRHGEVVDALHSWRKAKGLPQNGGWAKNQLIDMGIQVDSELVEVFEVKTSITRYDIYTAIGQLMVHGKSDKCHKVIVLPQKQNESLNCDIEKSLIRLNIKLLRFKLDEEKATIIE